MRLVVLCYFLLKKCSKPAFVGRQVLRGCLDEDKIKFNERSDSIYSKSFYSF
jgi:hypothetical protein